MNSGDLFRLCVCAVLGKLCAEPAVDGGDEMAIGSRKDDLRSIWLHALADLDLRHALLDVVQPRHRSTVQLGRIPEVSFLKFLRFVFEMLLDQADLIGRAGFARDDTKNSSVVRHLKDMQSFGHLEGHDRMRHVVNVFLLSLRVSCCERGGQSNYAAGYKFYHCSSLHKLHSAIVIR